MRVFIPTKCLLSHHITAHFVIAFMSDSSEEMQTAADLSARLADTFYTWQRKISQQIHIHGNGKQEQRDSEAAAEVFEIA